MKINQVLLCGSVWIFLKKFLGVEKLSLKRPSLKANYPTTFMIWCDLSISCGASILELF